MVVGDRLPRETAANERRYAHRHQLDAIASGRAQQESPNPSAATSVAGMDTVRTPASQHRRVKHAELSGAPAGPP